MQIQRSLATVSFLAMAAAVFAVRQDSYASDEVIVRFKPGYDVSRVASQTLLGASVKRNFVGIGAQVVKLPKNWSVSNAISFYKKTSGLDFAEPNYIRKTSKAPNDAYYAQQYAPQIMKMPAAWDSFTGDPSVVIAIIDTGMDVGHPDLASKVVAGYDFYSNSSDVTDTFGHGTHCAGIAAAATNNGIGIAGIGWNCRVVSYRIGPGPALDTAAGISALEYAVTQGVKVASMSYGGGPASAAELAAINYAWNNGIVLVAAAGNDATSTPSYPAAYPHVISVGASDSKDKQASFSNYGSWVRVAAPGVGILSTFPRSLPPEGFPTVGYTVWDGTSMACPAVAGLAGLLISYTKGSMTNAQIKAVIESNTDYVGTWVATGRVNGYKAISSLHPPLTNVLAISTIAPWQASSGVGDVNSLTSIDGNSYVAGSQNVPGLGLTAGAVATVNYIADTSSYGWSSGTLTIAGSSPSISTVAAYLYNFNSATYDAIKTFTFPTSGATTIALPSNITPYVSGTTMYVGIRGLIPTRLQKSVSNFKVSLDQLKVTETQRWIGG